MRLSEKTIELNICSQIAGASKKRVIWFGLTQAQEAKAGFDAAAKMRGRLMLFQFKASNHTIISSGARRFSMEHGQLEQLMRQASAFRRSVFYVFPLIGNTDELEKKKGEFLKETYLLDVSYLPRPYPQPTIRSSKIVRKNNCHHADVLLKPKLKITIHSEPQEFDLVRLFDFVEGQFAGFDGLGFVTTRNNENQTGALLQQVLALPLGIRRRMKGLIVL